jgi:hypothetical protein
MEHLYKPAQIAEQIAHLIRLFRAEAEHYAQPARHRRAIDTGLLRPRPHHPLTACIPTQVTRHRIAAGDGPSAD